VLTCVGWQVTLCDLIWQVTLRSCEMVSINSYTSFTFTLTALTNTTFTNFGLGAHFADKVKLSL